MNDQNPIKKWTREEIVNAIQQCAARLGRVPSQSDMRREMQVKEKFFTRQFGNFTKALRAAGFEGRGSGFMLSMDELFTEWAGIVRKLGAVPSASEYELESSHSLTPLRKRFRYLNDVPAGMLQYVAENGLEEQWPDVVEIARKFKPEARTGRWRYRPKPLVSNPRVLKDRPLYGAPLMRPGMVFSPVNEMGVVYLFGTVAEKLGFMVTWVGTQYPDAEAFREVEPGVWQRVRIEFEFQSRNFLYHFHDPNECDLIVCWEHNWAECPLQVVELKGILNSQPVAAR